MLFQAVPVKLTHECCKHKQTFSPGVPVARSSLKSEGRGLGSTSSPGEGRGGRNFGGLVDVVESVIGLDLDGDGQKGHGHGMGLVDGLEAVTGKDNCTAISWNHGFLYARTQHFLHLLLVLKVLVAAWGHFHCL